MKYTLWVLILVSALNLRAEADLKGKPPEDFGWLEYVSRGDSTAEKMLRAQEGAQVLKQRIDTLCAEYRKTLASRHEDEALLLFDEMQTRWKQAADAEVALIGCAWNGGAGAKAEFPKARLHSNLRRVTELKEIKARCLSLNE